MQRHLNYVLFLVLVVLVLQPAFAVSFRPYGPGLGLNTYPDLGTVGSLQKLIELVRKRGPSHFTTRICNGLHISAIKEAQQKSGLTSAQFCDQFGQAAWAAFTDLSRIQELTHQPGDRAWFVSYRGGGLSPYRTWSYDKGNTKHQALAKYWRVTVQVGKVAMSFGIIAICGNMEVLAVAYPEKPPPPAVTELTPEAEVGRVTEAREYHAVLTQQGVMSYGETPIQNPTTPYVPGVTVKQAKEGGGETVFTAPEGSGTMTLDQALVGTGAAAGSAIGGGTVTNAVTTAIAGGQSGAIRFTIPGGTWVIRRP